ncbi:MAG: DDE-type integrase/transposase/recombinase [Proteobacteria bacterium]|nr:DDE-type integrase/transposase/recombinase [Pseudomonadota bacterium]
MGLLRFVFLFVQYLGFLMFLKTSRRIGKLGKDRSEIRWERIIRENLCLKYEIQVLKHKLSSLEKRPRWMAGERLGQIFVYLFNRDNTAFLRNYLLTSKRTVRRWIQWLNQKGIGSLIRPPYPGRIPISRELRELIGRLKGENPLWGSKRIGGELLRLGIVLSRSTIRRILKEEGLCPTGLMRKSKYQNPKAKYPNQIWSIDFFILRIFHLKILYLFFILDEYSRYFLHFSVSIKPSAVSCAREPKKTITIFGTPEIIISDRDSRFKGEFRKTLEQMRIKHRRIPPRCPLFNCRAERFVGSVRRELLNHILPFSQKETLFYLSEYQLYYNFLRPHQGIDQKTPAEMYALPYHSPPHRGGRARVGVNNHEPSPFPFLPKINKIKLAGGLLNSYYFKKAA